MFSSLARQAARRSFVAKPAFRAPVWRRAFSATGASLQEEDGGEVEEGSLKRPTVQEVQMLPRHVSEYSADLLISAALHGDPDAIRERLVREVMRVDGVEWRIANGTVEEMGENNRTGLAALKLPYILGVTVGFVSAWGCLPLVFDLGTAKAFNTAYVTTEHPQPEDVETWLEVGAWTWNWMEPLLGTIRCVVCVFVCVCVAIFRLPGWPGDAVGCHPPCHEQFFSADC